MSGIAGSEDSAVSGVAEVMPSPKPLALEVKNLVKRFKQGEKELTILAGAELSLPQGQVAAIVGASGSGKSTFLQIAGLLDTPDSGEIWIGGQKASGSSEKERTALRREKLGFIYQFHHLLPDFTAIENIILAARIQKIPEKAAREQAMHLLRLLGVDHRADHTPARLSGGEQQRVAVARALIGEPAMILADEPTGNLDADSSERVFQHLTEIAKTQGTAALIATHDRELAARADVCFELKAGKLLQIS